MSKKVKITEDCIACGACESICPVGAIYHDDTKDVANEYHVTRETCIYCEACVGMCPVSAIIDDEGN
ncbi:MAG: 4Fe-4S binding protein [Firmicutes bacterium]|nr:4Fe-4S binding protein [Bacillota bacterium]